MARVEASRPLLPQHRPAPSAGRFALLHVAEAKLERQLWTLRRRPAGRVDDGGARAAWPRRRAAAAVVLTFDDGYADTLTAALPLLRQIRFRATCYVVSDCIGGHNRWDEREGRERQP